ncbi:MAG: DUF370 domain-containing protein [Clostridiales bacterium]|nr:DUF370 domain-containing protein [Clostridiales bacterium]
MILHIGAREMVFLKDIVAIIRYEGLSQSKDGKSYLGELKAQNHLVDISGGRPSSLVVLKDGRCYLSAISAPTLLHRYEEGGLLDGDEQL